MFVQAEHKNTIMRKNIKYLTILFLLLMMSSCTAIKRLVCGTTPLPTTIQLPDTALCTKDAKTMEENYKTLKGFSPVRGNNKYEYDNRVISFTYQQMKDNIEYLTAAALKMEGIEEEDIGFRVYIAAKAEEEFLRPGELDMTKGDTKSIITKPGETYYTTVFFVATRKGESEDPNLYENIYKIPALDYGGSRRPPIEYKSNLQCPLIGTKGHNH